MARIYPTDTHENQNDPALFANTAQHYDAILIASFGGPEGMDDVIPFLENVLRGRPVPQERLIEVSHHYELFGGVSPINQQNRDLIAALRQELDEHGINLPIYWGNRNWSPYFADTLRQMAADGIKRALMFVTSAYSSYSGCRQYREDIQRARDQVGMDAPQVDKVRVFYNHPLFIEVNVHNLRRALDQLPAERHANARIAFTAHSIPDAMAAHCDYQAQLLETCQLVAGMVGMEDQWELVYQSRSGSPAQPWLGPDILDHLRALKQAGATDVIVHPIGFVSDHIEVLYDLGVEAADLAKELGLTLIRASTVGTHPKYIQMIRELISDRLTDYPDRSSIGDRGPNHDFCPLDCCLRA
jgi:ferrochelatase